MGGGFMAVNEEMERDNGRDGSVCLNIDLDGVKR